MSENEPTTEVIDPTTVSEAVAEDVDPGLTAHLENLQAMKSFEDMAEKRGDKPEDKAADEEGGDEVEGGDEPDNVEPDAEVTAKPDAPSPFLVLGDGTELTKDEAVAGYMRHKDYTEKTMSHSDKVKEMEVYGAIIDRMKEDRELYDIVDNHIKKGSSKQVQTATVEELTVPENYKGDPFVEQTVSVLNKMSQKLASIEGETGSIKQQTIDEKQQAEIKAVYNTRHAEAFNELEGQLGIKLKPEDFVHKMEKHFEGKGLTPGQRDAMILGPDANYLRMHVMEAYQPDIAKARKDKGNSEREKRKPKGADKRALKATGKPAKAVSQKSPTLSSGRLDRKAFFRQSPVQALDGEDAG